MIGSTECHFVRVGGGGGVGGRREIAEGERENPRETDGRKREGRGWGQIREMEEKMERGTQLLLIRCDRAIRTDCPLE